MVLGIRTLAGLVIVTLAAIHGAPAYAQSPTPGQPLGQLPHFKVKYNEFSDSTVLNGPSKESMVTTMRLRARQAGRVATTDLVVEWWWEYRDIISGQRTTSSVRPDAPFAVGNPVYLLLDTPSGPNRLAVPIATVTFESRGGYPVHSGTATLTVEQLRILAGATGGKVQLWDDQLGRLGLPGDAPKAASVLLDLATAVPTP